MFHRFVLKRPIGASCCLGAREAAPAPQAPPQHRQGAEGVEASAVGARRMAVGGRAACAWSVEPWLGPGALLLERPPGQKLEAL